jgi:LmbE family N-acetylglucosaminyl deacetylase
MKTILGIGAHYDDCVFGISGILLKALRQHHRVVVMALIGDYSNWRPVQGREREIVDGAVRIAKEYGVEMRFLNFAEMKFGVSDETTRAVADAVADVAPDVALTLWPDDQHPDHEMAARLSKIALRYADRLIDRSRRFTPAQRIYQFDNGPRHTIGFEPNTFVDVTEEWPMAMAWLGKLMALLRNQPFDPNARDGAQRAKEALALYRGQTCGVRYAEAVRSVDAYPADIF